MQSQEAPTSRNGARQKRIALLIDECQNEVVGAISHSFGMHPIHLGEKTRTNYEAALSISAEARLQEPEVGSVWDDNVTKRRLEKVGISAPVPVATVVFAAEDEFERTVQTASAQLNDLAVFELSAFQAYTLKQTLGWALAEFTNSAAIELKRALFEESSRRETLAKLVEALKRQAARIQEKIVSTIRNAAEIGLERFLRNLFGYIVSKLAETYKKFASLIKDAAGKIFKLISDVVRAPAGMPGIEIARNTAKTLTALIIVSLGTVVEEGLTVALASVPVLAPFAESVSLVITPLIAGIAAAVMGYWIDCFFDWLASSGTEYLDAQIQEMSARAEAFESLASLWQARQDLTLGLDKAITEYSHYTTSLTISSGLIDQQSECISKATLNNSDLISKLLSQNNKRVQVSNEITKLYDRFSARNINV